MQQRPCRAPCLEKDIVEFQPGRAHVDLVGLGLGGLGGSVAGQSLVDYVGRDAVTQAARHAAEALLDLCEPLAEAVGARIELGLRRGAARQPVAIVAETLDRGAVFRFGPRQDPGIVIEKEFRFRYGQIGVFRRL